MAPLFSEIHLFILCISLILFLRGLLRPQYALFGYLIVMLIRPGQFYPLLAAIRFELLIGLLIGILIFLYDKIQFALPSYHRINKAIILFNILVFISIFQSVNIDNSYDYWRNIAFLLVVFYIMLVSLLEDVNYARQFIILYLALTCWLAYEPIFNHFMGIGKVRIGADIMHSKGTTGGVSGHVGLANAMTQSIPFAYFLLIYSRKFIPKLLGLICLIIFVLATIASGARGGFLGLVICAVLFWILAEKKLFASISIVCLAIIFFGMNQQYINWVSTILDFGASDSSASSRMAGLSHGIQMAIKRPILGVGIGCYSTARLEWFSWGIWAHNHYGELIGELGVLGTATWVWIIWLCFKELHNMKKFIIHNQKEKVDQIYIYIINSCWAVLVLRLIIGMTTHSLMSYIWYFIAGIIVISSKSLEKQHKDFTANKI